MPSTFTALAPAQVRHLVLATREFRLALDGLRNREGPAQTLDLLTDPLEKSEALLEVFRTLDRHQASMRSLSGAGDQPAIEYGLFGTRGRLEGVRAIQFLRQIDAIR